MGYQAGFNNTTASHNTSVGYQAAYANTTGAGLTAIGEQALQNNTTGSYNVAVGGGIPGSIGSSLQSNTTGSYNSALGMGALSSNSTSSNSTGVGYQAGYNTTGAGNQFFGYSSGSAVTSGAKNVILGSYTGSAAPISATGSNYIVLSDGDGNVRGMFDGSGNLLVGTTSNGILGSNSLKLVGSGIYKPVAYFENTQSNGNLPLGVNMVLTNDPNNNVSYFYQGQGGAVTRFVVYATGNVQNTNNSYGAISDIKLKQNISLSGSQWNDVKALGQLVKKFSLKSDSNNTMQIGWIAQDVQAISPGLVYAIPDVDKDNNNLGTETLSIQHSVAYMKAFKALSEALIRIEQLETKSIAAETEINSLKSKLGI